MPHGGEAALDIHRWLGSLDGEERVCLLVQGAHVEDALATIACHYNEDYDEHDWKVFREEIAGILLCGEGGVLRRTFFALCRELAPNDA